MCIRDSFECLLIRAGCDGKVRRSGQTGDESVADGIYGNASISRAEFFQLGVVILVATASEIGRVDKLLALGIELRYKGLTPTARPEPGTVGLRRKVERSRDASHEGIAMCADRNLYPGVLPRAAQKS